MRTFSSQAVLLSTILACGGNVSDPTEQPSAAQFASPEIAPEWVANAPSPVALVGAAGRMYLTTRRSEILGESSANGSLLLLREPGIEPLTLAIDKFGAGYGALAADASEVVWASADGRVSAIPSTGGDPRTIAREQGSIIALALDPTYVYYTVTFGANSAVKRASRTGGTPDVVLDNLDNVRGLTVSSAGVFVALGSMTSGAILRIDPQTMRAETLAKDLAEPCAVAAANSPLGVVWTERNPNTRSGLFGSCALATDGSEAFLGQAGGSAVLKASLATGTANVWSVQPSVGSLGSMAMNGAYLYWISQQKIVRARTSF